MCLLGKLDVHRLQTNLTDFLTAAPSKTSTIIAIRCLQKRVLDDFSVKGPGLSFFLIIE